VGLRLGLLFFLFFLFWFFAFLHCGLEVADAFTHTLAQRRKLAGAEEQKEDRYDYEPMPDRKLTHSSSKGPGGRSESGADQRNCL
jgi:hypothetical protein